MLVTRIFFLFAFFACTCVFPYIGSVNNPNENVRVYMTMALVEGHTLRIDDVVMRQGWVNDMARVPDKATLEYHLYSVKAPAVSYAGVPVYWAFSRLAPRYGHKVPTLESSPQERVWWMQNAVLVLRLFTVQLPCFFFLVWLERWLRLVSGDVVLRLSAVAATGLGTNYLAYAMMFASHSLFACAAFASFAITTRERALHPDPGSRRVSRAFLAGFWAGFATLLEYHALPVSVGLALYALTTFARPARLFAFVAGAALNAAALMLFQWRAFGNPLTPGHKFSETTAFREILSTGLFGITWPKLEAFRGITVDVGFGLFGTSPFMWLGLLCIPFGLIWRHRAAPSPAASRGPLLAATLLMATLLATVSAAVNWRAGWAIGPRYLGAAPPFLAYGALCALEQIARSGPWRRAIARTVAGGAAAASVAQSGLVSLLSNTLPEAVTRPLSQFALPMVRAGFVPHHVGELFGGATPTLFYVIAGGAGLAVALAALWRAGDRLGTWCVRLVLTPLVFALALLPALGEAKDKDVVCTTGNQCGDVAGVTPYLATIWEPKGRDRITLLRRRLASAGGASPCIHLELARLERMVGFKAEAAADDAQSVGATPRSCR